MCEDVNEILDLSSSSLGEQIFMKKYDDDDQRERWWWKKNFGTTLCACTMWGVLILVRKKSLKILYATPLSYVPTTHHISLSLIPIHGSNRDIYAFYNVSAHD